MVAVRLFWDRITVENCFLQVLFNNICLIIVVEIVLYFIHINGAFSVGEEVKVRDKIVIEAELRVATHHENDQVVIRADEATSES